MIPDTRPPVSVCVGLNQQFTKYLHRYVALLYLCTGVPKSVYAICTRHETWWAVVLFLTGGLSFFLSFEQDVHRYTHTPGLCLHEPVTGFCIVVGTTTTTDVLSTASNVLRTSRFIGTVGH